MTPDEVEALLERIVGRAGGPRLVIAEPETNPIAETVGDEIRLAASMLLESTSVIAFVLAHEHAHWSRGDAGSILAAGPTKRLLDLRADIEAARVVRSLELDLDVVWPWLAREAGMVRALIARWAARRP